jgi:hypothetical protein
MTYRGPEERYAEQAEGGGRFWGVVANAGRAAMDLINRGLDAMAERPVYGLGHVMTGTPPVVIQPPYEAHAGQRIPGGEA